MRTPIKHLRLGFVAVSAVTILALAAPAANADLIIDLTIANANLATQGAGPYAEYDITQTGTNTFHVVATGLNNFVFGDASVFDLNLSATAGTGTLTGSSIGLTQNAGSHTVDGFGTFNFVTDDGPGFSSPHASFTLDLSVSGTGVTLTNLLTPNSDGADAAGHLALATNTACTGFAANAGSTGSGGVDNPACTSQVPEPAGLVLLGTALAGLGVLGRWRRRETV
jgi:hypothetical protein